MGVRYVTYLYALVVILLVALPIIVAFGYAAKRGKSARTTASFVLPYIALLALSFFLLEKLRGFDLLVATVVVVAIGTLAFYVYAEIVDIGLRGRKN